jgi:hypothetical protein
MAALEPAHPTELAAAMTSGPRALAGQWRRAARPAARERVREQVSGSRQLLQHLDLLGSLLSA